MPFPSKIGARASLNFMQAGNKTGAGEEKSSLKSNPFFLNVSSDKNVILRGAPPHLIGAGGFSKIALPPLKFSRSTDNLCAPGRVYIVLIGAFGSSRASLDPLTRSNLSCKPGLTTK